MEMQAQSPEHLKLQVASQTCMPQQSGAFYRQQQISSSSGIWKKTWQTDSDVSIRRSILDRITQILRHRQTQSSVEYQQKLPDFVRRLEENLYRDAASKEEYLDLHTLEQRLQCAAKWVSAKSFQSPQQHGIGSVGCMIPTPGSTADVISMTGYRGSVMPTPGVDTMIPTPGMCGSTSYVPRSMGIAVPSGTMIPTPGHAIPQIQNSCQGTAHSINLSNALSSRGGNNMPNLQNGIAPFSTAEGGVVHGSAAPQGTSGMRLINNNHMTSCIGVGSQMIPTPGLDMSHSITVGHPSVPLGMSTPRLQQQQYLAGNHVYHGVNGTALGKDQRRTSPLLHTNGGMRNSAQFMANSQHLIPNVQPSPGGNSANHPNPNYGKMQNYHRTNHQRQSVAQNPLPAPISRPLGQPINTVNSLESGGTNSKTSSSAMTMSLAATASTMIPVPGMTARQLPRAQSPQQAKPFNQQSPLQQPQNEVIEGSALVEMQQQTPLPQGNDRHLEIPSFQQGSRSPLTYHPEGNEFTLQEMSDVDGEKKQQSQSETTQHNSEQQQEQEERIGSEVQEGPPKPHPQVLESDDLRHPVAVSGSGSVQQKHSDESSQPVAKSVAANGLLQTNSSAVESQRAKQYMKQQRWLLILRHASKCDAPEGQCQIVPFCHHIKQLVKHISGCRERDCQYARCPASRSLLQHHNTCQDPRCPVCIPVKQTVMQQQMQASIMSPNIGKNDASGALKRSKVEIATNGDFTQQDFSVSSSEHAMRAWKTSSVKTEGDGQPFPKRIKIEPMQQQVLGPGIGNGKIEGRISTMKVESVQSLSVKSELGLEQEHKSMASQEVKKEPMSVSKSGKPMIVGTSLVELFTIDQIKMHISSLRQWIGQNKVKIEKNQVIEQQMTEGACRLCGVEKLIFEPPPIYCTSCGARVKRNLTYYTTAVGESRHYFCVPCYGDIRNEMVNLDGQIYPKARLEKLKNDEETEEAWVQCDKCNSWQHQICALFNGRRNEGGDAAYTCPQCCVVEMEIGERKPLPPSAVLGARDLPKTILSDHLEQRLVRKLKQERTERARIQGKSFEEVLGADGLVVRVVSSVDKKLEVKQRFLDLFPVGEYPPEFPYKSKVILLFQRIEGVEVCLFGLYVQEFGSECPNPNQRRVYLSYLDSVKYFRPDVKTSSGEALRTFVYHEILIGYLEYCKKRGFCSCYIWACPPLRGEDYILYCHPEIQKTPKSDKLREWYLTMLQKASADNVVVEVTNFLDYFFSVPEECKTKVTAARLPYFDGDYWPGAAEDALILHEQEREEENRLQKKGKNKKAVTKRAPKVDFPANASKDVSLMHRLGQAILPMKEDFIMVHMHYMCKHCCSPIVGGSRWICKQCKNFNLCGRCYDADQRLEERSRHPVNMKEAHHFFEVEVNDVPADTKDKDEIMESEFFDTRQAFLSLCQGNHYQYDTLRRAKHSSMMVLYHLHNPTAPAFVTTCNICHHDIETGQGFRCDTCPDFDICNACYQKEENKHHPHELTPHLTLSEQNAQNKEARQLRIKQLRNMLILLAHASKCCAPQCQYYPKCRNVKGLFRHGIICRIRASGGCQRCKMMWSLLQLHARACRESECRVPRCKDLKEHFRRTQQQMDSRRRAAVNEMMRQRVAEVGGSS